MDPIALHLQAWMRQSLSRAERRFHVAQRGGFPALFTRSAELYFVDSCDLSRTTVTFTPLLCASTRAFAIGAEVKEYAWTRISFFAFPSSWTTASVAPPFGEKNTSMVGVPARPADTEGDGDEQATQMIRRNERTRGRRDRGLSIGNSQSVVGTLWGKWRMDGRLMRMLTSSGAIFPSRLSCVVLP